MTQQLDKSFEQPNIEPDAIQNKSQYEGYMEARLRELGANIDELVVKVNSSKAVEDLKLKQDTARAKFHELKAAGSEAWLELKKGMDLSWSELRQAFEECKSATQKAASKFER